MKGYTGNVTDVPEVVYVKTASQLDAERDLLDAAKALRLEPRRTETGGWVLVAVSGGDRFMAAQRALSGQD